jgi:sulfate permease, SulP family
MKTVTGKDSEKKERALFMFQGLLPIDRSRIPADIIAGITLAALAIPEVMSYTKISQTPVVTGLYTILIPMVLYAMFGGSRHLVVGADSATAAILASGLASMAVPRSAEWVALAGVLALMAGGFMFLARLLKLGFLADFLSRTALIGFLTGVGIQVAAGEISGMLGLPGGGHSTVEKLRLDLQQIHMANCAVIAISVVVLIIIVGSRRISKKIPAAIIAVIGSIFFAWALNLRKYGVPLLGTIPQGLPGFGLPHVAWSMKLIEDLLPIALSMFVVILTQSAVTSRAYAFSNEESFNEDIDMIGLGMANIGAGLCGTFVVNGSPTKTQMVESAGGGSQLAQLVTSLIVLTVLLFITRPLAFLPQAVLSTIVFLIGLELVDLKGFKRIYQERPWEFWVAVITAGVVVFVGVEQSIILAIVMSLVVHTRHGYRPVNVLLVYDDTWGWLEKPISTTVMAAPGLLIYRFMHNMYYANTQAMMSEVIDLAKKAGPQLKWFCIDTSAVNDVDFTAADTLRLLNILLAEMHARIVFCGMTDEVRADFDSSGLTDLFGEDACFLTLKSLVTAYERKSGLKQMPLGM